MAEEKHDNIQHGIDDDPNNDTQKGAVLGGAGGVVTGAVAGSALGPVGAVVGGAIGAVAGAAASGAAVNAVDRVDNDDTVTGLGDTPSRRSDADLDYDTDTAYDRTTTPSGTVYDRSNNPITNTQDDINHVRRDGIQTGGRDIDGTPDTRGVSEKIADAVTGDPIDDKTGKPAT